MDTDTIADCLIQARERLQQVRHVCQSIAHEQDAGAAIIVSENDIRVLSPDVAALVSARLYAQGLPSQLPTLDVQRVCASLDDVLLVLAGASL